jgi:antitoxin component of MazEF toxin-antitoxin module
MKLNTKVQKVAGSLYVRIPHAIKDELKISKGDLMTLDMEDGKIIVEKTIPERVRNE